MRRALHETVSKHEAAAQHASQQHQGSVVSVVVRNDEEVVNSSSNAHDKFTALRSGSATYWIPVLQRSTNLIRVWRNVTGVEERLAKKLSESQGRYAMGPSPLLSPFIPNNAQVTLWIVW